MQTKGLKNPSAHIPTHSTSFPPFSFFSVLGQTVCQAQREEPRSLVAPEAKAGFSALIGAFSIEGAVWGEAKVDLVLVRLLLF